MNQCCICKHQWKSIDAKTARKVKAAVKVNKDGPYCEMCMHLEMAERYALARGFESLEGGFKKWFVLRSIRNRLQSSGDLSPHDYSRGAD